MAFNQKEYQKAWRAKNPNYRKDWIAKNPNYLSDYRQDVSNRAKGLVSNAKHRSAKRNGLVTITADWVADKLNKGICEVTKLPFNLTPPTTTKNNLYAPSLDRIDSTNPNYSEDNTRVVLWAVNRLHGDDTLESVLPILDAVLKNQFSTS